MNFEKLWKLVKSSQVIDGIRIIVVGAGYVGLALAILRALQGAFVMVVDIDEEKINRLREGKPPFFERFLSKLLEKAIATKRIEFFTELTPKLVQTAQVVYICVNTNPAEDGSADLTAVKSVAKQIGAGMESGQRLVVIQSSTVPPYTTRDLYYWIREVDFSKNHDNLVAADRPEFLQQGRAFQDNLMYDRRIIGLFPDEVWARELIMSVDNTYESAPFIFTNSVTAELVKYASNVFLNLKIAYINLMARICDEVGADVTVVADAMGFDERIERWGLNAGIGSGGGCFPKDTRALIHFGKELGLDMSLIEAILGINDTQPHEFVSKIFRHFDGLEGIVVAAGGVSFKPETDFVYPSQSVEVIKLLLEEGAVVRVYDPAGLDNFAKLDISRDHNLKIAGSAEEMLEHADCYALLTEWDELILDAETIVKHIPECVVFDGRNVLDSDSIKEYGTYYGVGTN